MNFEDLELSPQILEAISRMGFETPTPVQAQVIPRLLKNEGDMVALAQTGTGKTAAFGLPILNVMDYAKRSPQALVLCPTRELCVQIAKDLEAFAACLPTVSVVAVYGGSPIQTQLRALDAGVQIIVATPGRMLDIMRRKKADLSGIERVILDEADEMLNMGFQEDLEAILEQVPDSAHTLLFSATMPRHVATIARKYMSNAEEITIGQRNAGAENVSHVCYVVHQRDRYLALKRIADAYPRMYAIVFCRTRLETQEVADWLIRDGYSAEALHGDLTQVQRDRVMEKFRSKSLQLLVATDVAARGLDVSDLTHVINYNLPDELGNYTHRSGRTGRAGKSGISIIIINMREKGKAQHIEKKIGKRFEYLDVPSGADVCQAQLMGLIERMKNVEVDEQIDQFLPGLYSELKGMDLKEIVARFLSLEFNNLIRYYGGAPDLNPSGPQRPQRQERQPARAAQKPTGQRTFQRRESKPVVRESKPVPGKNRESNEGPPEPRAVRMFINLGKADGLNPKKLADFIRSEAHYDSPVGRVDIMKKYSFFDVAAKDYATLALSLEMANYHGRAVKSEPVHDETKSKRFKRADRRKKDNKTFTPSRHKRHGERQGQPGKAQAPSKGKRTDRG